MILFMKQKTGVESAVYQNDSPLRHLHSENQTLCVLP